MVASHGKHFAWNSVLATLPADPTYARRVSRSGARAHLPGPGRTPRRRTTVWRDTENEHLYRGHTGYRP